MNSAAFCYSSATTLVTTIRAFSHCQDRLLLPPSGISIAMADERLATRDTNWKAGWSCVSHIIQPRPSAAYLLYMAEFQLCVPRPPPASFDPFGFVARARRGAFFPRHQVKHFINHRHRQRFLPDTQIYRIEKRLEYTSMVISNWL